MYVFAIIAIMMIKCKLQVTSDNLANYYKRVYNHFSAIYFTSVHRGGEEGGE